MELDTLSNKLIHNEVLTWYISNFTIFLTLSIIFIKIAANYTKAYFSVFFQTFKNGKLFSLSIIIEF